MTCQAPVDMSLNNADSRKQDAGKWPWIIQMQNGCTATLIGQNHALTSSGCCSALDFKVSGWERTPQFGWCVNTEGQQKKTRCQAGQVQLV